MLKVLTVALACMTATDAFGGASVRDRVFQAAYCLGAIRENHHLAATDCEERWISMGFTSPTQCEQFGQLEVDSLSERHQRNMNYLWHHLSKNPSAAKEVEALIRVGEDHVASNGIGKLEFHNLCMRDCLSWPPAEGCISPAD